MEKRKVLVTVEQASDGSYWCHTEDAINKGHFNSVGRTVEEAKQDLLDCYEEAREFEDDLPEVDFIYKYDIQSFFNYFHISMRLILPAVLASTHRSCDNISAV